jgi:hypothetical protein
MRDSYGTGHEGRKVKTTFFFPGELLPSTYEFRGRLIGGKVVILREACRPGLGNFLMESRGRMDNLYKEGILLWTFVDNLGH